MEWEQKQEQIILEQVLEQVLEEEWEVELVQVIFGQE